MARTEAENETLRAVVDAINTLRQLDPSLPDEDKAKVEEDLKDLYQLLPKNLLVFS